MKSNDPRFQSLLRPNDFRSLDFEGDSQSISNRVKNFLKRWPNIFNLLKKVIGPDHSLASGFHLNASIQKLFGPEIKDKIVLNVGSGTNRIHPEIINIDIFLFKNVDVAADISALPLPDGSVDGIICDTVLEHIENPDSAIREMSRVLKPEGVLVVIVPFLYPYHSSPNDFHRWTGEGVRRALRFHGLRTEELGVLGGPMGALQGVLMHIFAVLFSFGSRTLYFLLVQVFMALLSPLKLLDLFFMRFPYSHEVASGIYAIAKKNAK
jgi:SAM-dependent methyltransferase